MQVLVAYPKVQAWVQRHSWALGIIQAMIASWLLALIAIPKIPLYPTPVTLQTLGVFLIALSLGSKKGTLALIFYLIEASCGFPVLAGGVSNPLWMLGPNAGFLIGFVFAAFTIGLLVEKMKVKAFFKIWGAIICGQLVLYFLGVNWLAYFFGYQKAVAVGLIPFLPTIVLKALLATAMHSPITWVKKKLAQLG